MGAPFRDLSNECLIMGQWPGANPGGTPTWAATGQMTQAVVEFAVNKGYTRVMSDISNWEMFLVTDTQSSVANQSDYIIPKVANNNPTVSTVHRVYYAPTGLLYTKEFAGQLEFKSWNDYQVTTSLGMAAPFSFGIQPTYVAVKPDRTKIAFMPGPAQSGDTITVQYTPLPTVGAAICPTLVNPTDTTVLTTDFDQAIVLRAMWMLWLKAREGEMSRWAMTEYDKEIKRLRDMNVGSSIQDSISITNESPYDTLMSAVDGF
jgi:hypothetical protein